MECRRGLAMRKLSVRLSVRPSFKRVNCDKTEERSVQIFQPYERSFSLVYWVEEWLVGGDPFYRNYGSAEPRWSKIADFEPTFARRTSAVTPSEKSSINTNSKSITRFPMSLRWSSYVAPKPPKGAQKRKTAYFRLKSHFAWRKSASFFVWKLSAATVVRHSLGYLCVQKWSVGGDSLYVKFWLKLTALERNRRFSISFRS